MDGCDQNVSRRLTRGRLLCLSPMSPLCVSLTYLFLPHPLLFVAVVVAIATDLEVGEERCCVNVGEQVGGTLGQ